MTRSRAQDVSDPMPDQEAGQTQGGAVTERIRRRTSRPSPRQLTEAELSDWLAAQHTGIVERWAGEIRSRGDQADPALDGLLDAFLDLLVSFLSPGIGPWRDEVEPLFRDAAELYGSLGAIRGLAAGEAVEEMQLLREAILRYLFRSPPGRGRGGMGFREMLRLNRLVDLAVTHASVGHTDALFFNLLHGTGVSSRPRAEALDEIQSQLHHLAEERDRLFAPSPPVVPGSPSRD
jgi:hypothetical protein